MQRTKEIPNEPRFDYVRDRAYWLLLELGVSEFPVSPWDIIKEYSSNISCVSWSELRNECGETDPFQLAKTGADAKVLRKDKQFLIVYDDVGVSNNGRKPSDERIRWTIMHELGHIFLFHLNEFDEAYLDRGGLTDSQYGVLEKEANFFAAEMYIPTALFKYFDTATVEDLIVLCDISREAAQRRHRALYENTYHPNSSLDNSILRNFNNFIEEGRYAESQYKGIVKRWGRRNYKELLNLSRKCPICHAFTVEPTAKYCTRCGYEFEEENIQGSFYERLEEARRLSDSYSVFERRLPTSSDDKLIVCPVCLNQDISPDDEFCSICGQPLTNTCLEDRKEIDANYRHCPDCGEPTTFELPYQEIERRFKVIDNYILAFGDPDHYLYEHWPFIQLRMRSIQPKLSALLFCTKAFLTDDNDLLIYTDDVDAVQYITERQDIIEKTIEENESFTVGLVEVKLVYVL